MATNLPADLHEWVSFADGTEERTWVFDVTFLTSNWSCIFGNGCQGVLTGPAEELVQGCCSYGAHFIDDEDVRKVEGWAATLSDKEWQFKAKGARGITKRDKDGTVTTRLVDDACIFLNRPDFHAGAGGALHYAALERGTSYVAMKPEVCWQLPLRREELVNASGHVTTTITQWDRKHWGEGGDDFHWWCTEDPAAFQGTATVFETMAEELTEMVGRTIYDQLGQYLRQRQHKGTALPHPTVRKRTT